MMVGLLNPDAGEIAIRGQDVTKLPMYQRARLGLGYLAQEPTVFAQLSVEDNIRMVLEHHCPRSQRKQRLEELLSELNLTHLRDNKAGSCSVASAGAWRLPGHWWYSRACCFLTSPLQGLTPKVAMTFAPLAKNSSSAASRC